MTSNIVLETLKHVWQTLAPLHLKMALMGGLSVAFWRHPRATRDIDLLIAPEEENARTLLDTLEKARVRPRQQPPVVILGGSRLVPLEYEPPGSFLDVRIDLMFADTDYQKNVLSRTVQGRIAGWETEIAILACEDLILHKLLAGRLIDRADVVALLQVNPGVDVNYIQEWAAKLNLQEIWNETWKIAFPDA